MKSIEINDEVYLFEEQGAIHLKAVSGTDPTELTADEARRLRDALNQLISQIDAEEERCN